MKRIGFFILFSLTLLVTAVVAAVAGWFAMPMTAPIVDLPLFYLFPLMTVIFVVFAGAYLFGKLLKQKKFTTMISAGAVVALLLAGGWQWLFRPAHELLGVEPPTRMTDSPADYWELSTGSRIAYLHFDSSQENNAIVIWLHGGPGAYAVGMNSLHKVPQALADAGYEVYLYDQIGSGLSARLEDPRDYTLERHLEDLSAIQNKIGAQQVILIGSSWGATLATHYIARNPSRVSAAIFNAPGEIVPLTKDETTGHERSESDRKAKEAQQLAIGPRFLLMREIRLRNPTLFNELSSDAEWDAVMDYDINRFELKRGLCKGKRVAFSVNGFGLFAHNYTYRDFQTNANDPRARLQQNPLPVLLLRGECEFLSESIADQYGESFQNLQYANIVGAGHFITIQKPNVFVGKVKEFLMNVVE
ncbi:alpha/beta hydrolase [Lysobacter sp. A286]